MGIRLYNTLTRQKEDFVPRTEGEVSMYACGPTTYDYFHLGNARMLVVFDMIRRYFLYCGYRVTFVQNFTDVDDKIINRAAQEKVSPRELADFYIREYFLDAEALAVLPATIHPKATEHIEDMIAMIRGLEKKGLAYNVDGDVYFAVTRYAPYGKLSGRSLDDMRAGERVGIDERKENPLDFALWKKAAPGEPSWESPWGLGRPGWHIECSAMSHKYLGPEFDIHGGGSDLVFPHHENEMAQSEAFMDGQICARYWMHNAYVLIKRRDDREEKISKSLGNSESVRHMRQHFGGEVIRFYLLGTHYRSPAVFDQEKLEAAAKGLERLKTSVRLAYEKLAGTKAEAQEQGRLGTPDEQGIPDIPEAVCARQRFIEAMNDDFNSAQALSVLFDMARDLNTLVSRADRPEGPEYGSAVAAMRDTLVELAAVLGFAVSADQETEQADDLLTAGMADIVRRLLARAQDVRDEAAEAWIRLRCEDVGLSLSDEAGAAAFPAGAKLADVMVMVLELRARARTAKDWTSADMIRDCCKANGIIIEDTREGARWYLQGAGDVPT